MARTFLLVLSLTILAGCILNSPATVAPVDLSNVELKEFTEEELDVPDHLGPLYPLPYYLEHFHRLANSVIVDGSDRGFFDIEVWRRPHNNEPHNARVMENILSLVYFYTTDMPWNDYYGSAALRSRLEEAIKFWAKSQWSNGAFTEQPPNEPRLAPTAFATKFMGQALILLANGPRIDEEIYNQFVAALRRALVHIFTYQPFYDHGTKVSNQYGNAWAGALAYLSLHDDPELEILMRNRFASANRDFRSPAGYFYEHDGPDWGYNLGTHLSNTHMAWYHSKNTDIGNKLLEWHEAFFIWVAYNAVLEPSRDLFFLNSAIETRTRKAVLNGIESPLGEKIETARAFSPTILEVDARRARIRDRLEDEWPDVPELEIGETWAYSPYAFLHRDHLDWHPSTEQRLAARKGLPYLARDRFIHQRVDDRHPFVFTYVRRPKYYAVFNAGNVVTAQQRLGLGLVWHPQAGTFLQSQSRSFEKAWGTSRAGERKSLAEAHAVLADYTIAGIPFEPGPGARDLPGGSLSVDYKLDEDGRKFLTFEDEGILVRVKQAGDFVEQLPLIVSERDNLEISTSEVSVERGSATMTVRIKGATRVSVERTESHPSGQRLVVIYVHAKNLLTYSLGFSAPDPQVTR